MDKNHKKQLNTWPNLKNSNANSAGCGNCGTGHVKPAYLALKGVQESGTDKTVNIKGKMLRPCRNQLSNIPWRSIISSTWSQQIKCKPFTVTLEVNGKPEVMEIDSGASFYVISWTTHKQLWPQRCLMPTLSSFAHIQEKHWQQKGAWWLTSFMGVKRPS